MSIRTFCKNHQNEPDTPGYLFEIDQPEEKESFFVCNGCFEHLVLNKIPKGTFQAKSGTGMPCGLPSHYYTMIIDSTLGMEVYVKDAETHELVPRYKDFLVKMGRPYTIFLTFKDPKIIFRMDGAKDQHLWIGKGHQAFWPSGDARELVCFVVRVLGKKPNTQAEYAQAYMKRVVVPFAPVEPEVPPRPERQPTPQEQEFMQIIDLVTKTAPTVRVYAQMLLDTDRTEELRDLLGKFEDATDLQIRDMQKIAELENMLKRIYKAK